MDRLPLRSGVPMPARLFVIEDSRADLELFEMAMRDAGVSVTIDAVSTAAEAWAHLDDIEAGLELVPDLIVLDLNLPDRPGHEILLEIRRRENLARVPVVVLTGSATRRMEIERMGADAYVTKPLRYDELLDVVEELRSFLPARIG